MGLFLYFMSFHILLVLLRFAETGQILSSIFTTLRCFAMFALRCNVTFEMTATALSLQWSRCSFVCHTKVGNWTKHSVKVPCVAQCDILLFPRVLVYHIVCVWKHCLHLVFHVFVGYRNTRNIHHFEVRYLGEERVPLCDICSCIVPRKNTKSTNAKLAE